MNTNQMYYQSPEFLKAFRLMQITGFLHLKTKEEIRNAYCFFDTIKLASNSGWLSHGRIHDPKYSGMRTREIYRRRNQKEFKNSFCV